MGSTSQEHMRRQILFNNQLSVDLFCSNQELVQDIEQVNNTLHLAPNVGTMKTTKKATVPTYGEVWYDKNAFTNVLSLASNMIKHHRVTSILPGRMCLLCTWHETQ